MPNLNIPKFEFFGTHVIEKAWRNNEEYQTRKRDLSAAIGKICEECDICLKSKINPTRPVVGLPLAENFSDLLSVDIRELYGNKFLVMVD